MRKIALIALATLPLFSGFFPQTVHSSITQIDKKSISLSTPFPVNGMSGVVIHDYGNQVEAVTSRVIQNTTEDTRIVHDDIVSHEKLPTINTTVVVGDKVMGGYLYNNVLLLAPDAKTYIDITTSTHKNWIHPDLYALFLTTHGDNVPTKENLKIFAETYQLGLIYIVTQNSAKLLDPISGHIIKQKSMTNLPEKGKAPFFMRFDEIDSGLFSKDNTKSYYEIMGNL
jgi:hypothetical protein